MSKARLQIHTLAGRCLGEFTIRGHEGSWLPEAESNPPAGTAADWVQLVLHSEIFAVIHANDADFPIEVQWFLDAIHITPIVEADGRASCTVIYPVITFEGGEDEYIIGRRWRDDEEQHANGQAVIVGRWSDPGSLRVGLYLSSSIPQKSCIALNVTRLSVCMLEYSESALNHVLTILRSPKLSVVNHLQQDYRGHPYDTTLLHMILEKPKWNYAAQVRILDTLMSRSDADFSSMGWSSAMRQTVSGRELSFYEWQRFADGSHQRHVKPRLWVEPSDLRLHLLAISIHITGGGSNISADAIVSTLISLSEGNRMFHKKGRLRCRLLQDLGRLADTKSLQCGSMNPADISAARYVLSQMWPPRHSDDSNLATTGKPELDGNISTAEVATSNAAAADAVSAPVGAGVWQ
jgi:hypothetical protein